MKSPNCKVIVLLALVLGLVNLASAQSSTAPDWELVRPEKEQFSVRLPKGSTYEEASKVPYHKMELNTRFYVSKTDGAVFAVVSLSGIKSNPAAYTEMQRVNSYVDAFKTLFVPKIRDKGGLAQVTYLRERSLHGNPGREYRLTIGKLTGTAHVYATTRRFYALVYLNEKKDETLAEQFLSSFVIPERLQPATATTEHTPVPPARRRPSSVIAEDSGEGRKQAGEELPKGDEGGTPEAGATGDAKPKRAPISGGVLNGKAIVLPKPEYPAEAHAAGASGAVVVQVTIDESGMVISARAISGHPTLRQAAVNAANQARFSPTSLMGEPVKVTGVITYNFVKQP